MVALPLLLIGLAMSLRSATAVIRSADVLRPLVDGELDTEVTLGIEAFIAAKSDSTVVDLESLGIEKQSDMTSNYFEGDMKFSSHDDAMEFVNNSNTRARNAIRSRYRRWTGGVIPYTMSARYGSYSQRVIASAMATVHRLTCIKFVPRESRHRDYVYIHPDDGCYSLVGRTGGRQPLSLDAGCIDKGTIMHELMHVIGFFHEQSRADRDDWIDVRWRYVDAGAESQFDKYSLSYIDHLDTEYDYGSLMHYSPYAFSRNGYRTIVAKRAGAETMGQRDTYSRTDLAKINKLYYCDQQIAATTPSPTRPTTRATRRPIRVTTAPPAGKCEDKDRFRCYFWAMGIFGYCEKYSDVRNDLCRKACGTCTPTKSSSTATQTTTACGDSNPLCAKWADGKLCSADGYSEFMHETCAAACGLCGGGDAEGGDADGGTCEDMADSETLCRLSVLFDHCSLPRQRESLERRCAKSCGFCV